MSQWEELFTYSSMAHFKWIKLNSGWNIYEFITCGQNFDVVINIRLEPHTALYICCLECLPLWMAWDIIYPIVGNVDLLGSEALGVWCKSYFSSHWMKS